MVAEVPHTARGWLRIMIDNGISTRPVPRFSDLNEPTTYPDAEEIKPERVALAAIVSTRAYQRARKILIAQTDMLSHPSSRLMIKPEELFAKSLVISSAVTETMAQSILRDERKAKALGSDNKIAQTYARLNELMEPVMAAKPIDKRAVMIPSNGQVIENPSGAFVDVFGGVKALPDNMTSLIAWVSTTYFDTFGRLPDIPTILKIMENSYETYIKYGASLHKADSFLLEGVIKRYKEKEKNPVELFEGTIRFKPEIVEYIEEYRRAKQTDRSRKTTCAFLISTEYTQPYLDKDPEFEDPLKDAFDLYMKLLSA